MPSWPVTVLAAWPAGPNSRTVTPGRTAPLESRTTPVTDAVPFCSVPWWVWGAIETFWGIDTTARRP